MTKTKFMPYWERVVGGKEEVRVADIEPEGQTVAKRLGQVRCSVFVNELSTEHVLSGRVFSNDQTWPGIMGICIRR